MWSLAHVAVILNNRSKIQDISIYLLSMGGNVDTVMKMFADNDEWTCHLVQEGWRDGGGNEEKSLFC